MEIGLLLIFWYGMLHALSPDHLVAISNFSIGKSKKSTMLITFAFAFGHGVMLLIFAKILQVFNISEDYLIYSDIVAAFVIFSMGVYIIFMILNDKIHLNIHTHNNKEHIHIWYGDKHKHNNNSKLSALGVGALMGIGGARGIAVVFGLNGSYNLGYEIVIMFVLGVSVVFFMLGVIILYINKKLLHNISNIKKVLTTVGILSIVVGFNSMVTPHSHAVMFEPNIKGLEEHQHPHIEDVKFQNVEELVNSKNIANISYSQMMRQMGEGLKMAQDGIVSQNSLLVKSGIYLIDSHPAPKEKPWMRVAKEDREDFKTSLLSYDKLLHNATSEVLKSLDEKNWIETNQKFFELSNHCVSCHSIWKNKTIN